MKRSPVCGPGEIVKPNVVELPSGVLVPLSLQVPDPVPLHAPCSGSSTVSAKTALPQARANTRTPRISNSTFFNFHSPSADRLKLDECSAIDCPKGQGRCNPGSLLCLFISTTYGQWIRPERGANGRGRRGRTGFALFGNWVANFLHIGVSPVGGLEGASLRFAQPLAWARMGASGKPFLQR